MLRNTYGRGPNFNLAPAQILHCFLVPDQKDNIRRSPAALPPRLVERVDVDTLEVRPQRQARTLLSWSRRKAVVTRNNRSDSSAMVTRSGWPASPARALPLAYANEPAANISTVKPHDVATDPVAAVPHELLPRCCARNGVPPLVGGDVGLPTTTASPAAQSQRTYAVTCCRYGTSSVIQAYTEVAEAT
jgi:hypothetical protein